jgi:hypothetical protein
MRKILGTGLSLVLLMIATSSCATRVTAGYRAYDPGYRDYHVWGPSESAYYNRWAVETHRRNRDYRRLNRREQREYWNWRHNHRDGR